MDNGRISMTYENWAARSVPAGGHRVPQPGQVCDLALADHRRGAHSRHRRATRYRRPRPAACAIAGADRPVRPRWRSGVRPACGAAAASGTFLCNALDSCQRLMWTPSHSAISARSREIVQLSRSATGASSKRRGHTQRRFTLHRGRAGATVAFSTPAPSRMKSRRHSRTVSSRTPNAAAMRGLVQPASVSNTARVRSVSPRSREPASALSAARWSSVAESGDRTVIGFPGGTDPQLPTNPPTVGQAT
jgi:hypothetical protein